MESQWEMWRWSAVMSVLFPHVETAPADLETLETISPPPNVPDARWGRGWYWNPTLEMSHLIDVSNGQYEHWKGMVCL
jgi:hypothetical protein